MNENIQFLQDFLSYDSWRIAQLCDQVYYALDRIGRGLRQNYPYFLISFNDENDPLCELVQLLDGNNFEIEYERSCNMAQIATVIPCYLETIEVEYERECEPIEEPDLQQIFETIVAEAEADTECEERIADLPKHYDSVFNLYNNAAAASDIMYDEVLKPPW